MCLDSLEGPAKDDRVTLAQIGAHIAAGARLRQDRRGQSIVDAGDAILTPEGKLEHADASRLPDPSAATRELLGEAVKRVEQAKQRGRSAQEALALWWGLVDGRWSLVSHFEGSGRRYYVAVENPPESAKHRALSRPEAETVAYIASGTSTRDTAYALGLDTVTVRRHLRNAMAKLGIRTRVELIAFRATLLGHLEPTCVGA
jgi:DNA-binding CsgD family transcriptional regulator